MVMVIERATTTTRCSWCGRFRLAGRWVESRASETAPRDANYGICPACAAGVRASLFRDAAA